MADNTIFRVDYQEWSIVRIDQRLYVGTAYSMNYTYTSHRCCLVTIWYNRCNRCAHCFKEWVGWLVNKLNNKIFLRNFRISSTGFEGRSSGWAPARLWVARVARVARIARIARVARIARIARVALTLMVVQQVATLYVHAWMLRHPWHILIYRHGLCGCVGFNMPLACSVHHRYMLWNRITLWVIMFIGVDVVNAQRHTTYTYIHSWNIITLCQVGKEIFVVIIVNWDQLHM